MCLDRASERNALILTSGGIRPCRESPPVHTLLESPFEKVNFTYIYPYNKERLPRMPPSLPRLKHVFAEQLSESEHKPLPSFTARSVSPPVRFPGKVTSVIGMRRAGKTTFLHQLRSESVKRGLPLRRSPYISFEDEQLAGLRAEQLGLLVDEYHRRSPDPDRGRPVAWHFDEIQLVPGWERFVRRLLDSGQTEIAVTGSSAAILSSEIAASLRGRAWQVLIHPFTFEEVLRHQGRAVPAEPALMRSRERLSLEHAFLDWLQVGGYPEAQGLDPSTRTRILRDYVDVAMFRDVVERHQVSNVAGLRWLVRHLLGNAGSRFSVEKFYAALKSQGIAIAKDTVHQILGYLEDCFLVRLVWIESGSERQRMVNPRKSYPVDMGLIPVFDRTGRTNLGHALETAVLLELERRNFRVTYVRTAEGYEVDFLARSDSGESELIQVCADLSESGTFIREFRALDAAGRQFPQARKRLLTLTRSDIPEEAPADVEVQTAYEWFLERDPPS